MTASTGTRPTSGQAPDDQWLFTKSDLALTPSVLIGGLDPIEEKRRRFKGVSAIYRMGEYMRLPQHVMNTASIYLHRFYMRKPLEYGSNKLGHPHYEMAATCVFLACKVEESHRKLPSVIDAAMASFDKSPAGNQRWAERNFRADPSSKVSCSQSQPGLITTEPDPLTLLDLFLAIISTGICTMARHHPTVGRDITGDVVLRLGCGASSRDPGESMQPLERRHRFSAPRMDHPQR